MGTRKNFVIPGGITVDSSTLYVDDPNNRVGVNTTTPGVTLDVNGVVKGSSGVVTLVTTGAPTASIDDGAMAVDSSNNAFYFRSGSTWRQVSGATGPTGAQGATGSTGPLAHPNWVFSTTTTMGVDPGSGVFRFNSGTIGSVTTISISETDSGGTGRATYLDIATASTATTKSYLTFTNTAGVSVIFSVTAQTDLGAWREFTVVYVSGTLPAASNVRSLAITRNGDVGPTGSTGPTGTAGVTGPAGAPITAQDAAPSYSAGTFWYETDTGKLFIGYDGYWVEVAGVGPPGLPGGTNDLYLFANYR